MIGIIIIDINDANDITDINDTIVNAILFFMLPSELDLSLKHIFIYTHVPFGIIKWGGLNI